MSTAIFAAAYAVPQPDSLGDPGPSGAVSVGLEDEEIIDIAMALDDAARALLSFI